MTGEAVRILIVDDDDAQLYVKMHVLRRAGFAVSGASLGLSALEQVRRDPPSLVLLDVKLPDVSGTEICRRIKSELPNVLVLQTSATFTSSTDRSAALASGADSFLIEPIEPDELTAVVGSLLRLRRVESELRALNLTLEKRVAERTRELAEANQRLEEEAAARRRAEEALWHAQRLEAVGQLTGGVAHDFNNLLHVICGNIEFVERAIAGEGEISRSRVARYLGSAQNAARRGAQITQQLLAFARRSVLQSETIDVGSVISGFAGFLRQAIGEASTFELGLSPGLWWCQLDQAQFEAALLNLTVNARDAMPEGGRLLITTENVVIGDDPEAGIRDRDAESLDPGAYVHVRVSDNGVGMAAEVVQHVFEPFFTTKEVGKGSGLGLSQVYGFVRQSGGRVTIDSAPGRGTSVSLYLPRAEAAPVDRPDVAEADGPEVGGGRTVLVVEDDGEVRDTVAAAVSDLGYRVLLAANGAAALDVIRKDGPIDLLFTDVVMPGRISGLQLAKDARAIRRDLKVLLSSGHVGSHRAEIERAEWPIIRKPYSRVELAHKLHATLAADGQSIRKSAGV